MTRFNAFELEAGLNKIVVNELEGEKARAERNKKLEQNS